MDDYVKKMESDLGYKIPKQSPLYEILNLLNTYNSLPSLELKDLADSYAYYDRLKNKIVLNKKYSGDINLPTHEYTHALDNLTGKVASDLLKKPEENITKQENQFLQAYLKLLQPPKVPLDRSLPIEDQLYRYSPSELKGFGVGFYGGGKMMEGKAKGHIDATMATEQAILRELMQRATTKPENPFYQDPFGTMQYIAP